MIPVQLDEVVSEPYTRDLMISALGFLVTGNEQLADALERTLVALANNQTAHGHVPSLAQDPDNRGSSDSTPLFLFGLALFRISTNQPEFLREAAENARRWMQYQSPDDRVMVCQLPTSDWRDEPVGIGRAFRRQLGLGLEGVCCAEANRAYGAAWLSSRRQAPYRRTSSGRVVAFSATTLFASLFKFVGESIFVCFPPCSLFRLIRECLLLQFFQHRGSSSALRNNSGFFPWPATR